MPVWLLRRIMPAGEQACWRGFDRYRQALRDRAKKKLELQDRIGQPGKRRKKHGR